MRVDSRKETITVIIVEGISLGKKDAQFLRAMAKHCCDTKMAGSIACERLDKILAAAGIPEYEGGPVYGIFEEP